jgi:hypothetical protein
VTVVVDRPPFVLALQQAWLSPVGAGCGPVVAFEAGTMNERKRPPVIVDVPPGDA